jgi:tRNA A37 threonylcarbamoyladenosine modification protein TsaB
MPTIDARRGQVYAALARRRDGAIELLREPWLATPQELIDSWSALGSPPLLGTGIAADARLGQLPQAAVEDWPAATGIALLAASACELHGRDDLPPLTPFYLREPDAKVGRNPLADS